MPTTPTPRRLYVHDDITELAWTAGERRPLLVRLIATLFACLRREPHVVIITLAEQLEAVLARGGYPPFATAIGIGAAGERVARDLHARGGWFPVITRVDVTRVEDGQGGYGLSGPAPLIEQLARVSTAGPVAVVDDTLFSGITLRAVVTALPPQARRSVRAFCLRGVEESIPIVERLCPVTVGLAAPGRILDDVSFINASGLVRRGAIRRRDAPPLAFFERTDWMHAWFPSGAEVVIRLCRRLNALVDRTAVASLDPARAV